MSEAWLTFLEKTRSPSQLNRLQVSHAFNLIFREIGVYNFPLSGDGFHEKSLFQKIDVMTIWSYNSMKLLISTFIDDPQFSRSLKAFMYEVYNTSFFCLFVWVRIQAEISTQIPSFPRVVYASNKWSSTRPLFTRTWSYSRTFDHFIAHVWVLPWHVSLFVRYEVFCLTRCRRNRCMAKSWSVPTVPSIFFSPNKLICRGIKRFVTPAELRFYSIVFLFVPCAWQVFSGLVLIFCNPNLCTNAFENVNTSRKLVAF